MNTLAEKFRVKRKELGLSQQTLAEGICEQSQISKFILIIKTFMFFCS